MADFSTLKAQIAAVIKANGVQSITGSNFQQQLFDLIDGIDAAKVDAVSGKGLSKNDLTDALVSLINSAVQPAGLISAIAAAVADCVARTDVVQATGSDTGKVMSQKAVTDGLNGKANDADVLHMVDVVQSEGSSNTKVMAQSIVTNLLALKANLTDVYTKAEVNTALAGKADASDVYDKTTANQLLAGKADVGLSYTKNETDTLLAGKPSTTALDNETTARQQADNDLNTALGGKANLSDVYTKAQADALHNAMQALIDRINRDFGRYDNPTNIVLAVGTNGKYIDKDSAQEVSNANYAISTPLSLLAGDILLVPSASAVAAACSVVSKKVTKTYNKVIIYTYTYDEYGRVASATADYSASLVYTAHYASELETTPDYWTRGGEQYESLPSTHEVTESFYEPLVKQSVAAMPSEGYYVYLASSSMEVVVSAFTATINGGIAIKVGWGIFKNIATNFVGIDKQRVIAEAIAELSAKVEGIEDKLLNGLSKLKVGHLMVDRAISGLNVNGTFCLQAAGAPSASLVPVNWDAETYGDWKGIPQFIGQEYADTTNRIIYKAIGVSAVSDWLRISNA